LREVAASLAIYFAVNPSVMFRFGGAIFILMRLLSHPCLKKTVQYSEILSRDRVEIKRTSLIWYSLLGSSMEAIACKTNAVAEALRKIQL